jgi:RimJ/RimL family protein N-acetyltransferase
VIEGKLVHLRAPEMTDLERNTRWINDRAVTRFLSMRYLMSSAAEEGWLRGRCSRPMSFGDTFFAIETKDGEHIGNTNLFDVSPEDRKAEFGIMIGEKAYWSKGYGSDAAQTLLRFAFDEMNLNRVQLDTYAFNERALAAYRKSGFVEEGRRRQATFREGTYHDVVVMSALRHEWLPSFGARDGGS